MLLSKEMLVQDEKSAVYQKLITVQKEEDEVQKRRPFQGLKKYKLQQSAQFVMRKAWQNYSGFIHINVEFDSYMYV